MRKKKQEEQPQPVVHQEEKFLDVNATMQGTLRFDDPVNLRINGKFEGTLDTKGKLMIGHKASIRANITGESISIAGQVMGNIKATSALKLDGTARLVGDVETPMLSIQAGAVLNGNVNMGKSSGPGQAHSSGTMNIDEVASYMEVGQDKVNEWVQSGMLPASKDNGVLVFERDKVDQWIAQGKIRA